MSSSRSRTAILAIGLLAGGCVDSSRGCDPGWHSDQDQIAFYDSTLVIGAEGYFQNDGPILVGTVTCPRIDCVRPEVEDEDDPPIDLCPPNDDETKTNQGVVGCFTQTIEGLGVTLSDGCLEFTDAGFPVWVWSVTEACSNTGWDPDDDEVTFQVVDPSGLVAWFRPDADMRALDTLVPGPGRSFPEDAVRKRGETIKILEGRPVRLPIALEGAGGDVAWQTRLPQQKGGAQVASVVADALAGSPPSVTLTHDGAAIITIEAGARAKLSLVTPVASFELGEVQGVTQGSVASLELAVGYGPPADGGPPSPAGARAILRDGDGIPVYGGLISWEVVEGRLGLKRTPQGPEGQPDREAPDCDYIALAGDCYDSPYREELVKAVLTARFDDLEATQELEWVIFPGEDTQFYDQFAGLFGGNTEAGKSPTVYPCEGPGAVGCGCGLPGPGARQQPRLLVALLLIPLCRRRRAANAKPG